jgi:hypothetical protein
VRAYKRGLPRSPVALRWFSGVLFGAGVLVVSRQREDQKLETPWKQPQTRLTVSPTDLGGNDLFAHIENVNYQSGAALSGGGEERKTNHRKRRGASGREPKASSYLTLESAKSILGAGERRPCHARYERSAQSPAWPIRAERECPSRHLVPIKIGILAIACGLTSIEERRLSHVRTPDGR